MVHSQKATAPPPTGYPLGSVTWSGANVPWASRPTVLVMAIFLFLATWYACTRPIAVPSDPAHMT